MADIGILSMRACENNISPVSQLEDIRYIHFNHNKHGLEDKVHWPSILPYPYLMQHDWVRDQPIDELPVLGFLYLTSNNFPRPYRDIRFEEAPDLYPIVVVPPPPTSDRPDTSAWLLTRLPDQIFPENFIIRANGQPVDNRTYRSRLMPDMPAPNYIFTSLIHYVRKHYGPMKVDKGAYMGPIDDVWNNQIKQMEIRLQFETLMINYSAYRSRAVPFFLPLQ